MAVEALVQILAASAEVGFTVTARGVIDRESDDRATRGFHAPQNFLIRIPGGRCVQLIPDRLASFFAHLFDGRRGCRRQKLQSAMRFCRARATDNSPSAKNDFSPPVGHRKIGLLYVVPNRSTCMSTLVASRKRRGRNSTCLKPSRLARSVRVVVDAARHVGPMALHDLAVSSLLEIENVEGAGRAGDDVGSFLHALGEAALLEESGDSAERRNVRACGQKFNKFTTGSRGGLAHDGCRLYRFFFFLTRCWLPMGPTLTSSGFQIRNNKSVPSERPRVYK